MKGRTLVYFPCSSGPGNKKNHHSVLATHMAQFKMNKPPLENWRLSRIEEELEKLDIQSGSESEGYKSKENSPAPGEMDQDIYSKVVIHKAYNKDSKEEQCKEAVKKITDKYDSLRRVKHSSEEKVEGSGSVRLSEQGNMPGSPRRVDYIQTEFNMDGSGHGHIVYGPVSGMPPPPPMTPSPVSSPRTPRIQMVPMPRSVPASPKRMAPGRPSTLPRQSSPGMMAAYAQAMYESGSQEAPENSYLYGQGMYDSYPPPGMGASLPSPSMTYGQPVMSRTLPRQHTSSATHGIPTSTAYLGQSMPTRAAFPQQETYMPSNQADFPPPPPHVMHNPPVFHPQDCTGACLPHPHHTRGGRLSENDVLQVEMFYRSHKTEVSVCACHASMFVGSVKSSSPDSPNNDQWVFVKDGVPVLVLDSGESRRHRKLFIVLAEKGTGFILWKDNVNHLTHYKDQHPNFHTMHMSNDHTRLAGFSFDDTTAAAEFLQKMHALTSDPSDDILNLSGSKKKKKTFEKLRSKMKYKAPNKSDISKPCCFTHITKLDRSDGMSLLGTSVPASPSRDTAARRLSAAKMPKVSDLLPNDLDS